jgi:hypothetical protein
LLNAPWNPRTIDVSAAKKLRDNLQRVGLVAPLTWNKRTGHIVGGHQRIGLIDGLEGTPDYYLDVAVVDLDEKTEKAQAVLLNNTSAMGSWDFEMLGDLLKEGIGSGLSAEDFGFDPADIQVLFDDPILSPTISAAPDAAEKEVAQVNAIKARKIEAKGEDNQRLDAEFFVTVVGQTGEQVTTFLKAAGFEPDARYIDLGKLAGKMGITLPAADPKVGERR